MRQGTRAAVVAATTTLAVTGVVIGPLGSATAKHKPPPPPKPKTVTLKDSYYDPSKLSVEKGGKVVWKWSNANSQTHNVTLKKAPKGVKKSQFDSANAVGRFSFSTKFTKPGKYHFECTLHPTTMQADVTVKK